MKYFLIQERIRDGENEYADFHLTKAKNDTEANKNAIAGIVENYGKKPKDWDKEDKRLDLFDRIIDIESIKKITKKQFEVLKKVLWLFVV